MNAAPVAVFSVLADMENRAAVLKSVKRVVRVGPLPIETGTRIREKRTAGSLFKGPFRIVDYRPPNRISFAYRWLGIPLRVDVALRDERGGTLVTVSSPSGTVGPFGPLVQMIATRLIAQWERDLSDVRRHVEPRANPAWRAGLGA
ncbi:SRPBCC family protein [Hoeflea poritis]|uniref:SRPBCC family protein n=1 Tax=Hoeflea poritis TaxID=2993659 RepID=A0ABT4VSU7_9HYPH|nr:SRPBCC family protein [Hoeflea poritis]MDA4847788.1 hypothetical protein [Hoeflea poritis]